MADVENKVFVVCVVLDMEAGVEAKILVQPTAMLAKDADSARLHGVRLADEANADTRLHVRRLTVLVRPF